MKRLVSKDPNFAARFIDLGARMAEPAREVTASVARIIADVRENGDDAVARYAKQFDGRDAVVEVNPARFAPALDDLPADLRLALATCADRLRAQAEKELPADIPGTPDALGVSLARRFRPVRRAGIYVPGGRAAYPSSLLMAAIPARVAGVEELVVVTPLDPDAEAARAVLAAAHLARVDRMFIVGGAHAVAALAFGTHAIPRVDVIVGPGNAYVAEAKRQLYGVVSIDGVAGPSEVMILADESLPPKHAAADLLAQAEHDPEARCVLVTVDADYADAVEVETRHLAQIAPRREVIEASLRDHGAIIVVRDWDEAATIADAYAPEHLQIACAGADRILAKIRNAGAVFLGGDTPEALGDYVAGSNHVLPTAGTARFFSGLSAASFMRATNVIRATPSGLRALAPATIAFAKSEGLFAHAQAVELRLETMNAGGDES